MFDVHLRFHKKHEDIDIWLVVEPTPLKNDGLRQVG